MNSSFEGIKSQNRPRNRWEDPQQECEPIAKYQKLKNNGRQKRRFGGENLKRPRFNLKNSTLLINYKLLIESTVNYKCRTTNNFIGI